MILEDFFSVSRGEFIAEAGSFLSAELPVVFAPHFVRPTIAVRHREGDPMLGEHMLECVAIDGSRVGQRLIDLVTEDLLKTAELERLAP